LDSGGKYKWRRDGEVHQYNPMSIAKLQQAVRSRDGAAWQVFSELVDEQNRREGLIRGLFEFKPPASPIALDEVEPAEAIVRRFKTGAMSYGSISKEAHETLAIAMNRIDGLLRYGIPEQNTGFQTGKMGAGPPHGPDAAGMDLF
jgi:glutamate synthase domain-containing protein 2